MNLTPLEETLIRRRMLELRRCLCYECQICHGGFYMYVLAKGIERDYTGHKLHLAAGSIVKRLLKLGKPR